MEKANIKVYFLFGEEYYPTLQYDCNLFDDNTTVPIVTISCHSKSLP